MTEATTAPEPARRRGVVAARRVVSVLLIGALFGLALPRLTGLHWAGVGAAIGRLPVAALVLLPALWFAACTCTASSSPQRCPG